MAWERQQHRQPQYPVEDHNTVEAEWFYSLDAIQHCIKIKDLNVTYKAIKDREQNSDNLPGTCPCDTSTYPISKHQETSDSYHEYVNICITGVLQAGLGTKG